MNIRLDWTGGVAFCAKTESGHELRFDGAPQNGGKNTGPRPMEGLLSAAMACSAFDVALILGKQGRPLASLRVEGRAQRADSDPKVFTQIHLHFVAGGDFRPSAVERAVALSVEKYCSALRMLAASCAVSSSWEVVAA